MISSIVPRLLAIICFLRDSRHSSGILFSVIQCARGSAINPAKYGVSGCSSCPSVTPSEESSTSAVFPSSSIEVPSLNVLYSAPSSSKTSLSL